MIVKSDHTINNQTDEKKKKSPQTFLFLCFISYSENSNPTKMVILYVHLEGEKSLKDWTEKFEYSEQQTKDVTFLELKLVKKRNKTKRTMKINISFSNSFSSSSFLFVLEIFGKL